MKLAYFILSIQTTVSKGFKPLNLYMIWYYDPLNLSIKNNTIMNSSKLLKYLVVTGKLLIGLAGLIIEIKDEVKEDKDLK